MALNFHSGFVDTVSDVETVVSISGLVDIVDSRIVVEVSVSKIPEKVEFS